MIKLEILIQIEKKRKKFYCKKNIYIYIYKKKGKQ